MNSANQLPSHLTADSATLTLTLKHEWNVCAAAVKLAEDELALCCDKNILNAGIRARRLMRAAIRSLKTCIALSAFHGKALRTETRKTRSNRASKQSTFS